jgi:hypothetical protein
VRVSNDPPDANQPPGAQPQEPRGPSPKKGRASKRQRPNPQDSYPGTARAQTCVTRVSPTAMGVCRALRLMLSSRNGHGLSLMSASARPCGEQELAAVRKVHHPKIVQRSDGRWLVSCQDCERDRSSATNGINTPVDSFEAAERLWEGHCERRSSPVPRGV